MWLNKADYEDLISENGILSQRAIEAEGKVAILNKNISDHWENFKHNQEQQTELFEQQKKKIKQLERRLKRVKRVN